MANNTKWYVAIIILLAVSAIILLCGGCNFYMSISSTKEPRAKNQEPIEQPQPVKEKPKTRYEQLKEEYNKEWLNLPHDPIDSRFFPTDSNYNNGGKNWERKSY